MFNDKSKWPVIMNILDTFTFTKDQYWLTLAMIEVYRKEAHFERYSSSELCSVKTLRVINTTKHLHRSCTTSNQEVWSPKCHNRLWSLIFYTWFQEVNFKSVFLKKRKRTNLKIVSLNTPTVQIIWFYKSIISQNLYSHLIRRLSRLIFKILYNN